MKMSARSIVFVYALCVFWQSASALQISEILSNPVGVDDGREWLELYNESSEAIDIGSLSVSIKGGKAVPVTSVSGGSIAPNGYAIISSTVGGASKFLEDYPSSSGVLAKATMSLVNTGSTGIEIFQGAQSLAVLSSYTPAKEGKTLSRIDGVMVVGVPTPFGGNRSDVTEDSATVVASAVSEVQVIPVQSNVQTVHTATTPLRESSIPEVVVILPKEKIVVAGAKALFTVRSSVINESNPKPIQYTWAFGDGGEAVGSSTEYAYVYTGKYIAEVEARAGDLEGVARMTVRVVSPTITVTSFGSDSKGSYVDITNPNNYEIALSQWRLTLDGAGFIFPKRTILAASSTTRFSGLAMGFNHLPITSSTTVKILFPTGEEVAKSSKTLQEFFGIPQAGGGDVRKAASEARQIVSTTLNRGADVAKRVAKSTSTVPEMIKEISPALATSSMINEVTKDTRLLGWIKHFFGLF